MSKSKKIIELSKKAIDLEKKSIRFLMSTDAKDREGEVITKDGWILPKTGKCPMIDSHEWGNARNAFAAVTVWQDDEGLWGEANFASTQLGKDMFTLYSEEVLNQVSVGFLPYRAEYREVDGKQVYHILEKELFELSAVLIGANQDAVKKMMEDGKIGKKSFEVLKNEKSLKIEEMPSKKALDHLIDVSESLKGHRKQFAKFCKLFKIEPMDDESKRIDALGEAIQKMFTNAEKKSKKLSETPKASAPIVARTVTGKELDQIIRQA